MSIFHEGDGDESGFTCCAFSARERFLMLGTCSGHLKFYNVFSGDEEAKYTCHSSAITHLEPSRVGGGGPGVRESSPSRRSEADAQREGMKTVYRTFVPG